MDDKKNTYLKKDIKKTFFSSLIVLGILAIAIVVITRL